MSDESNCVFSDSARKIEVVQKNEKNASPISILVSLIIVSLSLGSFGISEWSCV
jgi:hypothetical protein